MASFWTPERLRRLREIAKSGRSMGEAAKALGCTRNAVAGAAFRNDIPFECPPERHRRLVSIGTKRAWARDDGSRRAAQADRARVVQERRREGGLG